MAVIASDGTPESERQGARNEGRCHATRNAAVEEASAGGGVALLRAATPQAPAAETTTRRPAANRPQAYPAASQIASSGEMDTVVVGKIWRTTIFWHDARPASRHIVTKGISTHQGLAAALRTRVNRRPLTPPRRGGGGRRSSPRHKCPGRRHGRTWTSSYRISRQGCGASRALFLSPHPSEPRSFLDR